MGQENPRAIPCDRIESFQRKSQFQLDDGEFNSTDLIQVLRVGEYADGIPLNSTWSDGDFGGDREFNTDDRVLALQTGAYETGPFAAIAVPEPASAALALCSGIVFVWHNRRQRREIR